MKNRKQKTISITISLAMAVLFATPLMAQNIHDVVCPPEDGHHCYTSIFSSQDKQNAMNSQQMQELALKLGSDLVQAAIPNFEITDEVKYLNVNLLLRQLEENSLVFNSEEEATAYYQNLFEITSNSMKANKIGDFDQYELMSLAIKKNQNRVLEQLLKAGFDPQVDLKIKIIEDDGQEHPAMPLTEIAEDVNNTEAVTLLQEYQQKKEDILNEQRAKAEERHITGIRWELYGSKEKDSGIISFDAALNEKEFAKWLYEAQGNSAFLRKSVIYKIYDNGPEERINTINPPGTR